MRKITAIVCVSHYKQGYAIKSLSFRYANADLVCMISPEDADFHPYCYSNIMEIQKSVVNIAKANNCVLKKWRDFEEDWYDIITVMVDTGKIAHYACL